MRKKGFKTRKFQKGAQVAIDQKKLKRAAPGFKRRHKAVPYTSLRDLIGTVKDYRIRKTTWGQTVGSTYTVDFPGKGLRKVETEYLTGVKLVK